jgi:hypothetical protein
MDDDQRARTFVDQDRVCFCCNRRESRIDHVWVGRSGKAMALRMRKLMAWVGAAPADTEE